MGEYVAPEGIRAMTVDTAGHVSGDVSDLAAPNQRGQGIPSVESIVKAAYDALVLLGEDGTVRWASTPIETQLGYRTDQLVGMNAVELVHPDDLDATLMILELIRDRVQTGPLTVRLRHADGAFVPLELSGTNQLDNPEVRGVVVSCREVLARGRSSVDVPGSQLMFRLLHDVEDGVMACDSNGLVTVMNDATRRLLGLAEAGPLPVRWPTSVRLVQDRVVVQAKDLPHHVVLRGEHFAARELTLLRADGTARLVRVRAHRLPVSVAGAAGCAVVFRDVTEQRRQEAELRRRALVDPLTGLPNRSVLVDRLNATRSSRRTATHRVAVLFCDLDQFKLINDTLGHHVGDQLLIEVATRLRRVTQERGMVCRLGGDEFVVLCTALSEHEVRALAAELVDALRETVSIAGHAFTPTASIGLAFDTGEGDPLAVMRDADIAAYQAKERGRDRFVVFDAGLRARASWELETQEWLRRAIADRRLEMRYQPVVDIDGRRIRSVEALVRFVGLDGEIIEPRSYLPVAERTGLITEIDTFVMRSAGKAARRWLDRYGTDAPIVSVNVSSRQFAREDFAAIVHQVLDENELPGWVLGLELSETTTMSATHRVMVALDGLRARGVVLGIDDFGVGQSSLDRLRDVPFRMLKIDKSFVYGVPTKHRETTIVRAVISLGHALGLQVVAEGVDHPGQLELLRAAGCDMVQGFLVSPPVTESVIDEMLDGPSMRVPARGGAAFPIQPEARVVRGVDPFSAMS